MDSGSPERLVTMLSGENTVDYLFSKGQLKKLIIPLIIDQTLAMSIGMFDTFMVSSAGESAVSGVSFVNTVNIMFIYLFSALATGGAIVAGQYLGSRDRDNGNRAAEQLLTASVFVSLLIMIFCIALNGQILSLSARNVHPCSAPPSPGSRCRRRPVPCPL